MPYVERLFRVVEPQGNRATAPDIRPLRDFFGERAIIVLGDPGAGKTTSFRYAAAEEGNAEYVTARDLFLLSEGLQRKVLYIDGLDEVRAGNGRAFEGLNEVRRCIGSLGRPSFRLSCRAADWFGESDASSLSIVSATGRVRVLQLEPLTDENILAMCSGLVADGNAFLAEADNRGVADLLRNPLNLRFFAEIYGSGSWPKTRTELFERACENLVSEANETHRRSRHNTEGREDLLRAAGRLCAIQLCSGINGFSLDDSAADDEFPLLSDLDLGPGPWREVVGRRLFQTVGADHVAPIHRAVTEYLGARHLRDRVNQDLPLRRALALLFGPSGGVPAPLKGLFGQLATMLPVARAETLIRRDPSAVVLHGDAAVLPSSVQLVLIEALGAVADIGHLSLETPGRNPFGGLASEDTEPLMCTVLNNPGATDGLVRCVLHSIMGSPPRAALGDSLLTLAHDVNRHDYLRARSVRAFAHCCPARLDELRSILAMLSPVSSAREEWEIRAALLDLLYPAFIHADEVFSFLVEDSQDVISSYSLFLSNGLVEKTSDHQLPDLLDAAVKYQGRRNDTSGFRSHRPWLSLLCAIPRVGSSVSAERLYRWLGLEADDYGAPLAGRNETEGLKNWFRADPKTVRELFLYWVDALPSAMSAAEIHSEAGRLWARLQGLSVPENFPRWFLEMAVEERNDRLAAFLFETAVRSRTIHGRDDAPSIAEVEAIVDEHPRFLMLWEEEKDRAPLKKTVEGDVQAEEESQRVDPVRTATIGNLERELEGIRSGTSVNALTYLAKVYFGLFHGKGLDREAKPLDRLKTWCNPEIARAALTGFVAVLNYPKLPSAFDVGREAAGGKYFPLGLVVSAGMELVFCSSPKKLLNMSSAILQSAVVLVCTNPNGRENKWVDALAETRPDVVAEALGALWRPQLAIGAGKLHGIYHIRNSGPIASAAGALVIELIREYPRCSFEVFRVFLSTAVRFGDPEPLSELIGGILSSHSRVTGPNRTLWYAAGLILQPTVHSKKFTRYIGRDTTKVGQALAFISPGWVDDLPAPGFLKVETITALVLVAGRVFQPSDEDMDEDGGSETIDSLVEAVNQVHELITKLEKNPSKDAADALSLLSRSRGLEQWSQRLARATAHQRQILNDTGFCYPTALDVSRTLSGGAPATPRDLQALTAEHLRDLGEQIRHGSTDGYKAFWNTDSYGRPRKDPQVENVCRDRLLEQLQPMLERHSVNAERESDCAEHKRADIKVVYKFMNLPIEIKRHNHPDLWTAPRNQLQKLYARDPGAAGCGIYLVLWFGVDWEPVKKTPKGIPRPTTAQELEDALRQVVESEKASQIDVIVFDCGRTPADTDDRSAN